jgi:hypothetical protein
MAPLVGASSRKRPLATRRGELNRPKGRGPPILLIVVVVLGVLLVVIISLLIRSIFFSSDILVLSSSLLLSTTISDHGDVVSAASHPLANIVQKESISINNDMLLTTRPVTPITVAYAISLIKVRNGCTT